jgi:hypothetical protein
MAQLIGEQSKAFKERVDRRNFFAILGSPKLSFGLLKSVTSSHHRFLSIGYMARLRSR